MQKDLLRFLRDPNLIPSEKQTLLSNIAAQAAGMDMPCYLVGGSVRDLLLNKSVKDLDIIVEGDAIKLGEALVKKYGGKFTPHKPFHTAIWHLPSSFHIHPSSLDLITARKESYTSPGALPTVEPSTIEDDLRRRDFTINAMAIRLDGEHFGDFLDPLNGHDDLQQKIVRVLHPNSFIDDPTRIFRAIRYVERYSFNLQPLDSAQGKPSTFDLINTQALEVLSSLSGERLRHELDLIFAESNSAQMILRIGKMKVLNALEVETPQFNSEYSNLLDQLPDEKTGIPQDRVLQAYLIWLIETPAETISKISGRLDFSADLTESAQAASTLKRSLNSFSFTKPSQWTFALEKYPLMSVYAVYLISREKALYEFLVNWRSVKPNITGDDLKAQGLPPGPRYKEILTQLRAAWLDGDVKDENQEKELLNSLL